MKIEEAMSTAHGAAGIIVFDVRNGLKREREDVALACLRAEVLRLRTRNEAMRRLLCGFTITENLDGDGECSAYYWCEHPRETAERFPSPEQAVEATVREEMRRKA